MAAIRPRDLLTDDVLRRLGGYEVAGAMRAVTLAGLTPSTQPTASRALSASRAPSATLARDIARLRDIGYFKIALPTEFGGMGCTLRQAACAQRQLTYRAPLTALAVSAHLYWTGAATDAYRSGDTSVKWILLEAARGALFAGGHGLPGNDLQFASPQSRCLETDESGYRFRNPGVLNGVTPGWDWTAVHAVTEPRPADDRSASDWSAGVPAAGGRSAGAGGRLAAGGRSASAAGGRSASAAGGRSASAATRPEAVLAFAGRGSRCTPSYRVARVLPSGSPADVFTTSAMGWGFSILASVQYSIARSAFNDAVRQVSRPAPNGVTHPLDRWPVAEASLRLDGIKARIADVTHLWLPHEGRSADPGGRELIKILTMRHEVSDGARRVLDLVAQITDTPADSAPAPLAR